MQVLSKMTNNAKILTYKEYYDNNVNLAKYKIPELKEISKANKLKISGTKKVLIERISEFFCRIKNIIKIQSILRMYLVKMAKDMKGPGLMDRKLCLNDTDFYTLEPLNNINYFDFFSYKDEKNFIWGFDINSIMIMIKKPGNVKNPYNRSIIGFNVLKKASIISKLNKYVLPAKVIIKETTTRDVAIEKIKTSRRKPIDSRIEELFYEIDALGNYTSSSWFKNLSGGEYMTFIRCIWDIWNFRANIPSTTKRRICPYFNPFQDGLENINIRIRENVENVEIMKNASLTIMENIIYTGINNEFKQLGAMHVLSALTIVSPQARGSLPWLYESVEI
tara:strand:- start:21 stop:1025 length:1005 start_codon:yes stop_codon:yes gene_type:complete